MEGGATNSGPAHGLERMIFFSDAVFAIAITLLIIEIHVPHLEHFSDRDFLVALAQLGPSFLGFFISFYVIGAFWAGHHRAFNCARHWDQRLMFPNLMLLSAVAALPFFTAFSSQYYGHRVPVALYCGWLFLISLLNMRLQRIALAPPVVGEDVPPDLRATIRRRGMAVVLGTGTAFAIAFFYPSLAQPALCAIGLWRVLLEAVKPRSA